MCDDSQNSVDSLEETIEEAIKNYSTSQLLEALYTAMTLAFTEKELLSHTVSGKPSNGKSSASGHAKPQFDLQKFSIVCIVLYKKFPELVGDRKTLTAKIHAVIKKIKRNTKKESNKQRQDK